MGKELNVEAVTAVFEKSLGLAEKTYYDLLQKKMIEAMKQSMESIAPNAMNPNNRYEHEAVIGWAKVTGMTPERAAEFAAVMYEQAASEAAAQGFDAGPLKSVAEYFKGKRDVDGKKI